MCIIAAPHISGLKPSDPVVEFRIAVSAIFKKYDPYLTGLVVEELLPRFRDDMLIAGLGSFDVRDCLSALDINTFRMLHLNELVGWLVTQKFNGMMFTRLFFKLVNNLKRLI